MRVKQSSVYVPGTHLYKVTYHATIDVEIHVYASNPTAALEFAEGAKTIHLAELLEPKTLTKLH